MAGGKNNIVVEIADDYGRIEVNRDRLKKMIRAVCRDFNVRRATVSVAVVGEEAIRKINRRFLNCDEVTDVISFDLSEQGESKTFELVVNGQCAARQARLRRHKAGAELALYVVHGLLHNLGFDDSSQHNAQRMHKTEDKILQQLGYGKIYDTENHA